MLSERMLKWERQWLQEGRRQGEQEGERKGEAALLLRLLERKFGLVERALGQRIEAASAEDLLRWGERVLTAERPEDIFAGE